MSDRIVTIQQTPKSAKLLKLLAVVLAIIGAVVLIVADAGSSGVTVGAWLLGSGVVVFIFARVLAYWRSG